MVRLAVPGAVLLTMLGWSSFSNTPISDNTFCLFPCYKCAVSTTCVLIHGNHANTHTYTHICFANTNYKYTIRSIRYYKIIII